MIDQHQALLQGMRLSSPLDKVPTSDFLKTHLQARRAVVPLCQRSCPPLCFSSISQVGGIG